ncbi:MAG: 3-deoxy-7-phosphoheptulonate synthase [Deferribacteres bacterium]|nr:3-deoxy-7-phosphoheptulonate synthase [candidate division KSB1 bacterium]MCB9501441.1 3-deoxy-7-phosphoheptulonate synthase [Deferribacteres bacterium]
MLVILHPNMNESSEEFRRTWDYLQELQDVRIQKHIVEGNEQRLTEVYLIGNTQKIARSDIESLPAVERVIRISEEYRILGRHNDDARTTGFEYQGLHFNQSSLHIFAGLCAVDIPEHVEAMMRVLQDNSLVCTRMGAYKPRTSPYSFQGHGKSCLPYVFELAGKYGIKVIAMEVTHESHVEEIDTILHKTGNPTGIMLQIGTRNTQNFELLKVLGRQKKYPILLKRGFGITLSESLNAAEYLATEGNANVVFCLRGMKTSFSAPHRNMVDFSNVPVVKRLTRMPVCIDPSHSVGTRDRAPDGLLDIFHATAQGIVSGANMVLVDFHPEPKKALVDGPQALLLPELPYFLEDIRITREAYLKRLNAFKSQNI